MNDLWRTLTVEEIAKINGISLCEAKYIHALFEKTSVIISKFKYPKREIKRIRNFKKIIDSLPCTFSVIYRKTKLSKPALSRYLKLLVGLNVVKKRFDPPTELFVYYLDDLIAVRDDPFYGVGGVLDVLYSQKEYWISRLFREDSKVKLARAGKKTTKN